VGKIVVSCRKFGTPSLQQARLHHFHSGLPVDMIGCARNAHHAQGDCSELHCTIIGCRVEDQCGLDLLLIESSVIGRIGFWISFNGVFMDTFFYV
jgi:hypothetical protein